MSTDSVTILKQALPYARRYARALSGSQEAGDALVAACLRRGLAPLPVRLALYAGITRLSGEAAGAEATAPLTALQRRLLLLTNLEELTIAEAASVLGIEEAEAERQTEAAREALQQATSTEVLIIEDEPLIAMDLRQLIQRSGHKVVGLAASEAEAVRIAREKRPGLIIADVNLGLGGDGIDAVRRILRDAEVPVIFVTAHPERLLTAEGVEPAFVMNKPFDRMTLAIATYQAITAGRLPLG
jgi:CheY-like chemotaxis protein